MSANGIMADDSADQVQYDEDGSNIINNNHQGRELDDEDEFNDRGAASTPPSGRHHRSSSLDQQRGGNGGNENGGPSVESRRRHGSGSGEAMTRRHEGGFSRSPPSSSRRQHRGGEGGPADSRPSEEEASGNNGGPNGLKPDGTTTTTGDSANQAQDTGENVAGTTLYIRNLPTDFRNEHIRSYFERYGEVVDCRVVMNPVTKDSRGFGFVSFPTSDVASEVMLKLDGTDLNGKQLRIEKAKRNKPHDPTPGEYKGPTGASIKYDNRGKLKPGYVPYWHLPVPGARGTSSGRGGPMDSRDRYDYGGREFSDHRRRAPSWSPRRDDSSPGGRHRSHHHHHSSRVNDYGPRYRKAEDYSLGREDSDRRRSYRRTSGPPSGGGAYARRPSRSPAYERASYGNAQRSLSPPPPPPPPVYYGGGGGGGGAGGPRQPVHPADERRGRKPQPPSSQGGGPSSPAPPPDRYERHYSDSKWYGSRPDTGPVMAAVKLSKPFDLQTLSLIAQSNDICVTVESGSVRAAAIGRSGLSANAAAIVVPSNAFAFPPPSPVTRAALLSILQTFGGSGAATEAVLSRIVDLARTGSASTLHKLIRAFVAPDSENKRILAELIFDNSQTPDPPLLCHPSLFYAIFLNVWIRLECAAFSTALKLFLVSLACTIEALKVPIDFISRTIASLETGSSTLRNVVTELAWLLDESKLERKKLTTSSASSDAPTPLVPIQLAIVLLGQSTERNAALGREFANLASLESDILLGTFSSQWITLPAFQLSSCVSSLTVAAITFVQSLLLPELNQRDAKTEDLESYVTDLTGPAPVPYKQINPDFHQQCSCELECVTQELQKLSKQEGELNEGSEVLQILDAKRECLCRAIKLMFDVSRSLLSFDEISFFKSAAQKSLKKKKKITTQLPYGKPLQKLFTELPTPLDFSSFAVLKLDNLLTRTLTPQNQSSRRPKVAKGCVDILPGQMVIRDALFSLIRETFSSFGAVAIETPVFELKETLVGKYGDDQKLIYDLKDQGGEQLALRYDLTVPFARFCATHNIEKIKRYHIGKVYRRDEPQLARGRYREFYQCDFDIAGEYESMIADAEAISVAMKIFERLESKLGSFEIRINHRRLLDVIMETAGIDSSMFKTVCSSIDKLDKCSWAEVEEELQKTKGVSAEATRRLHDFVSLKGSPDEVLNKLRSNEDLNKIAKTNEVLNEMKILFNYLKSNESISFDLSLARGLDYYTGVIFEVALKNSPQVGSVSAGGRYDNLIGMFSGKKIPAVGLSIGVERLFRVLEQHLGTIVSSSLEVFVCSIGNDLLSKRMHLCNELRRHNIAADFLYAEKPKLGKQLNQANELKVPFVVIFGEDELQKGTVKVKELKYGEDTSPSAGDTSGIDVRLTDLCETLKSMIAKRREQNAQF